MDVQDGTDSMMNDFLPISGWVYVLQCKELGLYKIGKTAHLSRRIMHLNIQLPFRAVLLCLIPLVPGWENLERELHDRYAKRRKNGEWFELNQDDLESLKQNCQMGAWLTFGNDASNSEVEHLKTALGYMPPESAA
jgi:hypothetical protein